MEDNFLAYIQKLESLFFFSGYPLVYAVIVSVGANRNAENNFRSRLVKLLPYSYALSGTFYLGLLLRNIYYQRLMSDSTFVFQPSLPAIWGLLSLLCWLPAIAKRKIWSLVHSLVFLLLIIYDIFFVKSDDLTGVNHQLRNDMVMYSFSLLFNLCSLAIVFTAYIVSLRIRNRGTTSRP